MYFWRDKKLAHDLHKGFVSEKEQMFYLLLISIFMAIFLTSTAGYNIWSIHAPLTLHDYASDMVYLIMTALIIVASFKINNTGDGKDFLIRFTCLSLPISIKSTLVGLILGILGFMLDVQLYISANPDAMPISPTQEDYDYFFENNIDQVTSSMGLLLTMIFMMIYIFWRYTVCFKVASGQKEYGE